MRSLPPLDRTRPFVRPSRRRPAAHDHGRGRSRPRPCPPASPRRASPPASRNPDGDGVRAGRPALRLPAGRPAARHQERRAARDAVPDRHRRLDAASAACSASPSTRPSPRNQLRLRLLHGHHARRSTTASAASPRTATWRSPGSEVVAPRPRQPQRAPPTTTAARSTSAPTASSTSPSARTRTARTRRRSPTCSARSCASTPTARSRPTTRSSAPRPAATARSGRSACATRSPSPSSPAPAGCSSTTSAQNTWEEINDGVAGANYGWPTTEGPTTDPRFRSPIFCVRARQPARRPAARSPAARSTTRATAQFPAAYAGDYFFADFCGGWIRMLRPGDRQRRHAASRPASPSPVDLQVGDRRQPLLPRRAATRRASGRVEFTGEPGAGDHDAAGEPDRRRGPAGDVHASPPPARAPLALPVAAQRRRHRRRDRRRRYTLASATARRQRRACSAPSCRNALGSATSNGGDAAPSPRTTPPTATITAPAAGTLYTARRHDQLRRHGHRPRGRRAAGAAPSPGRSTSTTTRTPTRSCPPTSGSTGGSLHHPDSGRDGDQRLVPHPPDRARLGRAHHHDVRATSCRAWSTLTLATSPPGLQLTLDGQPVTTPVAVGSVVGMRRTLGVVSPQSSGGDVYAFQSWSDGGAATHTIATPATEHDLHRDLRRQHRARGRRPAGLLLRQPELHGHDRDAPRPHRGLRLGHGRARRRHRRRHLQRALDGPGAREGHGDPHVLHDERRRRAPVREQRAGRSTTGPTTPPTENSGTIALTAGQIYDIRMEFYENGGAGGGALSWSAPGAGQGGHPAREPVSRTRCSWWARPRWAPATRPCATACVAGGFVPVLRDGPARPRPPTRRARRVVVISSTSNSRRRQPRSSAPRSRRSWSGSRCSSTTSG